MKNLKSNKLIITFVVLAFMMSFSGNAFAADNSKQTKVAVEQSWINPVSRDLQEQVSVSQSKNILGPSLEVTSFDELKSKIQYILTNRLTDVNIHATYCDNIDNLMNQTKTLLDDSSTVDDYVFGSIIGWNCNVSGYKYDYSTHLQISYVETKDQADMVEVQVRQILSQIIKTSMSDFEKEKAIHDYIVSSVAYDTALINHSDYGALFNKHTTVCQGYALLCYKMLTDAGITARLVISDNGPDEDGHAWNMVQINGKWYHLDCTYDDPVPDIKGRVEYNYFNRTDSEMAKNHTWDRTKYPQATTEFNFATDMPTKDTEKPTIDSVILDKNGQVSIKTSYFSDNTKVNFGLVHEDGSDASQTDGKYNIILMDDTTVIYGGFYSGEYFIPEYVPEDNYKIKVVIGNQTAYSNIISVKRDSTIIINSIKDGYIGKDISSMLAGTVSDKDGIDDVELAIKNNNKQYINLDTGIYDGKLSNIAVKLNLNEDGTFVQNVPVIDKLADGKYTIEVSVFDSNGFETVKGISFTKVSAYDWQKILNDKPWKAKYSSLTELNTIMDVPANKKFTVKFSQDVNFSTLNNSEVQVVDAENGQVISSAVTKLTSNSMQIALNLNLEAGKVYYIIVNNDAVKAGDGKSLKNGVVCPFKVADNI